MMWWCWNIVDILTTDIWIQNELNVYLASNVSDFWAGSRQGKIRKQHK